MGSPYNYIQCVPTVYSYRYSSAVDVLGYFLQYEGLESVFCNKSFSFCFYYKFPTCRWFYVVIPREHPVFL